MLIRSVSRAHTCSRSATPVLRGRRRRRSTFTRATKTGDHTLSSRSRYTTQRYRASPSGSVVMAALETPYATQAREDTAFHELLPFPCLSFSLSSPPPLSSSPSRSRATRFPPSPPSGLQAGRGPRTVRWLLRRGRETPSPTLQHPTTLLCSLTLLTLSVLLPLPRARRASRSVPYYDRRTLGRSRFFVSWRVRQTSAGLGHRRSLQCAAT